MRKIRLLIFSKYAIVSSALRHLLSSVNDIEIVGEADTLQKTEQAIQRLHPDVVLVETVDTTTAAIPQLTEKSGHAGRVPIVVLTTLNNTRFVRAMLRAGVTGYVLKQSSD